MLLYGQEPEKESYPPAKFCSDSHSGDVDKMFLVCDAVSQESTIKEGPCEFMGESKIRVNLYEFLLLIVSHYYSNFSGHRH